MAGDAGAQAIALVRADGTGEVRIGDAVHELRGDGLAGGRQRLSEVLVAHARTTGGAGVRAQVVDPEGTWHLHVSPDGRVDEVSRPPEGTESPETLEEDLDVTRVRAPGDVVARAATGRTDFTQRLNLPVPDGVPAAPVGAVPGPGVPAAGMRAPEAPEVRAPVPAAPAPPPADVPPPVPAVPSAAPRPTPPAIASAVPATAPEARRGSDDAPSRSFLTSVVREEPARSGLRGGLNRVGFKLAPGEKEQDLRAAIRALSQHWAGPRTISVVNGKGGAGKTTDTIMLAAMFATYGGSGVLAWDNNDTRGTLGWRTEQGGHDASVMDLLPHVERLLSPDANASDLAYFVHHQVTDKYDVLRSRPEVLATQQRMTVDAFDAVHRVATKYYRLILVDSGNDESAERWLQMVERTDQLVVATSTLEEHAEAGRLLLLELAERDERSAALARNAVVIVSHADRDEAAPAHIAEGFRRIARDVVAIPYDTGMRARPLRFGTLRGETRDAWLRAGSAVAAGL